MSNEAIAVAPRGPRAAALVATLGLALAGSVFLVAGPTASPAPPLQGGQDRAPGPEAPRVELAPPSSSTPTPLAPTASLPAATPTTSVPTAAALLRSGEAAAPIASHVLVVVRDPGGAPVEGAWVAVAGHRPEPDDSIADLGERPHWEADARASTDVSGGVVLPLPPGERFVVHARFGQSEGRSAPFTPDQWVVEVVASPPSPPPPGLGALILRVRVNGSAAGRTPLSVALTRRPIVLAGAYGAADVGHATLRGTTDTNGELAIGRLPTGAYDLVVSAAGQADARVPVVVEAVAVRLDVHLDHAASVASGPLVPPAGLRATAVQVVVVTSLGDYPAVVVRAPDGGDAWRWRAPGLPPGEHLVVGAVADHGARCAVVFVGGAATLESGPTLSWAGAGALRGRLVAQDQTPLAGERVVLSPQWRQPSSVGRPRPPFVNRTDVPGRPRATAERREAQDRRHVGLSLEATTDADGRFVLRGAEPGPYLLVGPYELERPIGLSGDLDLGNVEVHVPPSPPRRRCWFTGRIEVEETRLREAWVEVHQGTTLVERLEVDASGSFAFEVELGDGEAVAVRASGTDVEGRPLFPSAPPLEVRERQASAPLTVLLLRAARLRGRLLLPPALAGRVGKVVVREVGPKNGWQATSSLGPDGGWSVGFVPANRPLEVWSGASVLQRLTLRPAEERELTEDLSARTVVQALQVDDLPDPLASCSASIRWGGGDARAPLLRGRGVVPGIAPDARATLHLEVEEPETGTFWRVVRDLSSPGREPVVIQLPRGRGRVNGELPPGARAARVRARGPGPVSEAEVGVSDEGRFLLDVPVGVWRLEVAGCAPVEVWVREAIVTEVTLQRAHDDR